MYPKWMQKILYCNPCRGCRIRLDAQNVQAVGIRYPEEFEAWKAEPVLFISLACPYCGQVLNLLERQPLPKVLEAVTAFARVIEQQCEGKEPPLKIPGLATPNATAHPTPAAPTINSPDTTAGSPDRPRPSLRRNQPTTPPTQAEVRAFLNRLRRTPFKRGTKGFNSWMKGFGVDPDAKPDSEDK